MKIPDYNTEKEAFDEFVIERWEETHKKLMASNTKYSEIKENIHLLTDLMSYELNKNQMHFFLIYESLINALSSIELEEMYKTALDDANYTHK